MLLNFTTTTPPQTTKRSAFARRVDGCANDTQSSSTLRSEIQPPRNSPRPTRPVAANKRHTVGTPRAVQLFNRNRIRRESQKDSEITHWKEILHLPRSIPRCATQTTQKMRQPRLGVKLFSVLHLGVSSRNLEGRPLIACVKQYDSQTGRSCYFPYSLKSLQTVASRPVDFGFQHSRMAIRDEETGKRAGRVGRLASEHLQATGKRDSRFRRWSTRRCRDCG